MTPVEPQCKARMIRNDPVIKQIELKNIGFLRKQPTFINCPACETNALSVVRLEPVTCLQRFLDLTNWCVQWEPRCDINHYCSRCGCFIGRHVTLTCMERCISRTARKKAARDDMTLKTKPKDCADHMQKARERVQAKRVAEKAAKAERKAQQQREAGGAEGDKVAADGGKMEK